MTSVAMTQARHTRDRRRRMTLRGLANLMVGGLVIVLAVMAIIGTMMLNGIRDVEESWNAYDLGAATKSDALSELRSYLGAGGVVDLFHEYQVQGPRGARAEVERAVGLARANLETYRYTTTTSAEEERAITAISDTLDAVITRLPQIEAGHAANQYTHILLRDTAVDFSPTVEALRLLDGQLSRDRASLGATNRAVIDRQQRILAVGGGVAAVMLLVLAVFLVVVTHRRVLVPLARLMEESRRLARRQLDQPFVWTRRDELGQLGRTLEDSRSALAALFSAIDEKTQRLTDSEQRYAMAAAATNDGLWDWDSVRGNGYASPRLHQMLGLTDGALNSFERFLSVIHPDDVERVRQQWRDVTNDCGRNGFELEFRFRQPDGGEGWMLTRSVVQRDEQGHAIRIVGSSTDITRRKAAEQALIHQATHDYLTGLPNRAFLIDWLRAAMEGDRAERHGIALLFLDLDGFKVINDSLGHAVGDRLLIAVADRISAHLAAGEFAVRLGGDEFVVVTHGEEAALAGAERLEQALTTPFRIDEMELRTSTSIGVAIDDGLASDPVSLLRDADIALYRAKEHGRARTEVFTAALRDAILIRHRLQNDLTRAIEEREVFLLYQPIVSLADGRLTGFEALVRWRHPELGLIGPDRFIPIAEETGQILPLGRFVLEEAVRNLTRWRADTGLPLSVNVNLSARQMWDAGYVDDMLAWLRGTGCAGLKIEVTESMTMTDPDRALAILGRFHDLGIPLCMDDFGTGYSSLSYLGRFPFDVLKIDKSFVRDLAPESDRARLVRGIVNLAHDLGLDVVGEGVETDAEQALLNTLGCDYAQGYRFARPLSLEDANGWVERARPPTPAENSLQT
ncbi:GGDEF and EAL domain-containing protein [Azospirillum griseum]|nr:GGDEF and EAL domain-containing protein [Azospirillum griseum]